jgi:Flp pilus assembly protein TadD
MPLFGRREKGSEEIDDAKRQRRAADAERSALLFLKGGLLRPAEADLRRCVSLTPDYAAGHHYLGMVLYRLGELDEANRELETAVSLAPGDEGMRRTHGTILEALGRNAEAEQEYGAAIGLDPESGWAHAALGKLLLRRGDLGGADEHLLTAVKLNAGDTQALADLAEVRRRRGSVIGAIDAIQRALAVFADVETPLLLRTGGMVAVQDSGSRGRASAPFHARLGMLFEEAGDVEHALAELRAAHEQLPGDTAVLSALGRLLMKGGRDAEVQSLYERAIKADPAKRAAYETDLYELLVHHSSGELGATAATPAVSAPSPHGAPHSPASGGSPVVASRERVGAVSEATARLEAALAADPQNSRLHSELSIAYVREGKLVQAKEHARLAEQYRHRRSAG